MTRTLIFLADSHFGAYNLGLVDLAARGEKPADFHIHFIMPDNGSISRQMLLSLADGRRILNPVMVKTLDRPWEPPGGSTPSVLNRWNDISPLAGTDHQIFMLWGFVEMHWFAFEKEWSGYGIEGEPEIDGPVDRYLLPRGLVREQLKELVGPVLECVLYLAARGLRIDTLSGPPPDRSNAFICEKHPGMTPSAPSTRLVLYELICEIFRDHARDHGYRFHEVPSRLRDELGFLRAEYRHDGIHASAAYGIEMLRSLFPQLNRADVA